MLALDLSCEVVLADTVYGERSALVNALEQRGLRYVVAIRSTHEVWREAHERIRTTSWRAFERVFTDGSSQERYLQETLFGRRRSIRYFQITTDPVQRPPESTWPLLTTLPGNIEQSGGNTFGLRTWIEIVCAQMTKTHALPFGRGGNDVANLDLTVGDHHPVD